MTDGSSNNWSVSLRTLSFQVAQLGLEKEVLGYIPEEDREDNPFVTQNYLVQELERELTKDRDATRREMIEAGFNRAA